MKQRAAKAIIAGSVFSALLFCLPAFAQEPVSVLSLERAVGLAAENDVRVLPGKTAWSLAQLQESVPVPRQDPEARFSTGLNSGQNYLTTSLRFFPQHPWRTKAEAGLLGSATAAAAAEYQTAQLQTAAEVFRLYREIQCMEKDRQLLELLAVIKKELAALKAKQVDEAVEISSRALLARWEQRDTENSLRELLRKIALLKNTLAARTGLSAEELRLPPVSLTETFGPADADSAACRALGIRPDLRRLQALQQASEAKVDLVKAARIPWINHIETSYSDRSDEWAVQVAVSIPVFSLGGSQKGLALAELSLREAEIVFSEKAASSEVQLAAAAFNSALNAWMVQRDEHAELAEATRREIEKIQGSLPQERLVLEERLVQAERDLLNLLRSVYSAQADLFFATGQPRLIRE